MTSPRPLVGWTPVTLARSGATQDGLKAPLAVLGVNSADGLPRKALIRPDGGGEVRLVALGCIQTGEFVKAGAQLCDALNRGVKADTVAADLKWLSRRDWLRYDAETRANAATAVAAVLVAAWAVVVAALDDAVCAKIIGAVLALLAAVLAGVLQWRARR